MAIDLIMQKQLGKIDTFSRDRGFGFIKTLTGEKFFFHISAAKGLYICESHYYFFSLKPSKKQKDKLECEKLFDIRNETDYIFNNFFNYLPKERFEIIIINREPLNQIAGSIINQMKQKLLHEASFYVQSFDLDIFKESIVVHVEMHKNKKPGEDDSFYACIKSIHNPIHFHDSYLKEVIPKIYKETYKDYGFYSCYSMQDDYLKSEQSRTDKVECDKLTIVFRREFIESYDKQKHLERYINDYMNLKYRVLESDIIWNNNESKINRFQTKGL